SSAWCSLLDIEAGTLVAEQRLDGLENTTSMSRARDYNCGGGIVSGSSGSATTFLDLSQATASASGISGAAVLQNDAGAGATFAYLSTESGASGALIRSPCTEEFMPDNPLHSMLGMRLTADASPSGFVAVAVGYSGDISSADFAVLR